MIKQIFTVSSQMFMALYSNNMLYGYRLKGGDSIKNVAVKGSLKECGGHSS